jgi:hypothetical protein
MPENAPDGERNGFHGWWEERSLAAKVMTLAGFAILGLGFIAIVGLVVMVLWNWLMPDIFGIKRIDYWQAWGLLILSWILFKPWGRGNGGGGSDRKRREHLRRYVHEDL